MEEAVALGDVQTFREINHKLKPSLLFFPNYQVNEAMRNIEGNQPIENIQAHFPKFKKLLSIVIEQVKTERERLKNGQ